MIAFTIQTLKTATISDICHQQKPKRKSSSQTTSSDHNRPTQIPLGINLLDDVCLQGEMLLPPVHSVEKLRSYVRRQKQNIGEKLEMNLTISQTLAHEEKDIQATSFEFQNIGLEYYHGGGASFF